MSLGTQLPPYWDEYWQIVKVMDDMQAMILSKMNNHISMKSKTNREQDTSNWKHKGIVLRFGPPLYVPAFTIMKDFAILKGIFYKETLHKGITTWSTQDRSTQLH